MAADKEKPGGEQTQPGGGGLVAGLDPRNHDHYSTFIGQLQPPPPDFPALHRAVDQALASGDYTAYCEARRALLLAQAAAYSERRSQ
jgi:hypothetical protein